MPCCAAYKHKTGAAATAAAAELTVAAATEIDAWPDVCKLKRTGADIVCR